LIRFTGKKYEVLFDFAKRIDEARAFVQLDSDGKNRGFDQAGEDSTGATFKLVPARISNEQIIGAFTPHKDGHFGLTVAEYQVPL